MVLDLAGGSATAYAGFAGLQRATADLEPPFAVLDVGALRRNAADMVRRAGGKPIRLASKSIRCREVIRAVLALDGFEGVLAFTLPEALWLADEFDDIFVGYPTVDREALRTLAKDERLAERVTLMVDSVDHLDYIESVVPDGAVLRICLDLDASLKVLGLHLGPRRSPAHGPSDLARLAREVVKRDRFRLVGVMSYEGQIAGVGDNSPGSPLKRVAVRTMQRFSAQELRERRAAAVQAVEAVAPLEFVNGGGTGSLEATASEDAVTELGAGSGLYSPRLFDHYQGFRHRPAAYFALPVVRRPADNIVTVLGGGWIASGPVGKDRLPVPVWPAGLKLTATEGAGEVQTPLAGPGAVNLRIGDRVWFRHAKAGELCEHVDVLHLVDGDRLLGEVPTYRGESKSFA